MLLADLRTRYHQRICEEIIRIQPGNPTYPNFADKTNNGHCEATEVKTPAQKRSISFASVRANHHTSLWLSQSHCPPELRRLPWEQGT